MIQSGNNSGNLVSYIDGLKKVTSQKQRNKGQPRNSQFVKT